MSATRRQVQDVTCRVLLDNGEIERIRRIERDETGRLYVRTVLGRIYEAERIISIIAAGRSPTAPTPRRSR